MRPRFRIVWIREEMQVGPSIIVGYQIIPKNFAADAIDPKLYAAWPSSGTMSRLLN